MLFARASVALQLTAEHEHSSRREQAELQAEIEAADAWNLERHVSVAQMTNARAEHAWQVAVATDALRCPPDDWAVTHLSGVRVVRLPVCIRVVCLVDTACVLRVCSHVCSVCGVVWCVAGGGLVYSMTCAVWCVRYLA